jgi:hypothetical protein
MYEISNEPHVTPLIINVFVIIIHNYDRHNSAFLSFFLALQFQFGPWPTSMRLSVSLRFYRS